jgi:hypothetical protein
MTWHERRKTHEIWPTPMKNTTSHPRNFCFSFLTLYVGLYVHTRWSTRRSCSSSKHESFCINFPPSILQTQEGFIQTLVHGVHNVLLHTKDLKWWKTVYFQDPTKWFARTENKWLKVIRTSSSRTHQGRVRSVDVLTTWASLISFSRNCQSVSPAGLHPPPFVRGPPRPLFLVPQTCHGGSLLFCVPLFLVIRSCVPLVPFS